MDPAHQNQQLGEFRIEGVLGQGGSGIVYDATWGPRRVALKVLHPSLVGTGKERAQFLTEAQRLQQIMHPSVVKVLALGQLPDGRPYLAMERLDGETLASVIARGALPLDRALAMFGELCSAVAALHAQGLVHRDLKPENVFVVADRHAVLLDFGIAKDITAPASTTTQEGNVRGTPAYMAPERFFGSPAGIATDVYELALVLYVMLAGRLPWDEVADPEARLSPRPLASLQLAPSVPEPLDTEIRRALSTRAQNRPSGAQALLDAVRAAASGADTDPEPSSTARLRSGAQDAVAPTLANAATAERSERQRAALATTIAAPTTQKRQRAKRSVLLAIGGAIALASGAVAAYKLTRSPSPEPKHAVIPVAPIASDAAVETYDPKDPWSTKPAEPSKAFALVDEKHTPEQYRAEASAAVQKLPNDTRFLFTVQLTELRDNSSTNDLLDKIAKHPKVAPLALILPPCVKGIIADAEWFVFGAPTLEHSSNGTLVLRGRWRRSDVEACFADTVKVYVANDGAKLFRVGDEGWLDFLDDHTAVVTLNTKLEAEALHKLTKKPQGPITRVKQMFAALPANRTIALVSDGKNANEDWSSLSLPKGSDVFGWIRVESSGMAMDLAADPHNTEAAKAAILRIKPDIDNMFLNTSPDTVGKLEVVAQGTVVHVRGRITSLMISLVTASISL
ncbi:MAG TPA: protein kinase [Kofleriaceae bacterium]|nr:protein kinase [Kofleriaceae bacterium]